MAIHDHTARARLSFSSSGDTLTAPPATESSVSCAMAPSLRLSHLDDVALALYALAALCIEDESCRKAQARQITAEPALWPLPPLFREGVQVAMQCLEQYARQLDGRRDMNV